MRPSVRRAAAAHRRAVRGAAEALSHDPVYAEVLSVDPVRVTLHDADIELEAGDSLQLTQWVRKYDAEHVIDVGDTLLVRQVRVGDDDYEWVATDVKSDKAVT